MVMLALALSASAGSPLQDIPEALGDSLQVTDYVAKMIMAIGMIAAFALVLAAMQLHPVGIMFAMIAVVALLVAIGWLDTWVLFILCVIAVVAFSIQGKTWFTGSGG